MAPARCADLSFELKNVEVKLGPVFMDDDHAGDSGVALGFGLSAEVGEWGAAIVYAGVDYWKKEFDYIFATRKISELDIFAGLKHELDPDLPFDCYFLTGGGFKFTDFEFMDSITDLELHLGFGASKEIADQFTGVVQIKKSTNGANPLALLFGLSYELN